MAPGWRRTMGMVRIRDLFVLGVLWGVLASGVDGQERLRVSPGSIRGRVTVHGTGQGLADVEVGIKGTSFTAVTDRRGDFSIDPTPPGDHVLGFRRLGYEPRADSVRIPAGAVLVLSASLAVEAIELEPLTVVVRSAVLDRGGFYDRRAQGYRGHFLDRADIEGRRPDTMTDLFRHMSGLRVIHGGLYGSQIFMNQFNTFREERSPGCAPAIWIDGVRSTMRTPDVMRVEELEGLEVYTGASSPGKYNDLCGVIVIWTRQRINR